MENASKALLIAAAVLIVILIIAFGMRIFNSAGDAGGQAGAVGESTSLQTFNAQFTAYKGRIPSSSLISLITLTNTVCKENPGHMVQITMGSKLTGKTYIVNATDGTAESYAARTTAVTEHTDYTPGANIDEISTYKVSFGYDAAGYIIEVIVKF